MDSNKRLKEKYQLMKNWVDQLAGYPVNADFDYSRIYQFLEMPMNNVGDPAASTNYQLNTHEFEREVLEFVAKLYGMAEDYWGYITNGGSEGNLCALHIARDLYPDAMVYFSEHSHYSVEKAVRITRSNSELIPVLDSGELDYDALEKSLRQNKDKPAILMLNYGTTMTGAIDDLRQVKSIINKLAIKDYYIHLDAALHGMIVPFTESELKVSLQDFDSLAISGHKLIGSPLPCGIFLTKQSIIDSQQNFIEYVQINDATITGSRNAITPLILWLGIFAQDKAALKEKALATLANADYAVAQLKAVGIAAWANPVSPIVVFPKPSEAMIRKWQLAPYQKMAHIVCMPHFDEKHIDAFVADMKREQLGEAISLNDRGGEVQSYFERNKKWLSAVGLIAGTVAATSLFMTD
jgi:histidine decarboxylase